MVLQKYAWVGAVGVVSAIVEGAAGWEGVLDLGAVSESAYEDIQGGQPAVEEVYYGLGLTGFNRSREGQLAWDLGYEWIEADWKGSLFSGVQGQLYEEVETLSGSVMWTGFRGKEWSYSVLAGVQSSRGSDGIWEKADFADALGYSLGASLNYQVNPTLLLGFGAMYKSNPAGIDEDWFPIVQIFWEINEEWTLRTRNGVVLIWEPEVTGVEDEWTFSALWRSRNWHLGDAGPFEMGYEDEGIALGIAYRLEPLPGLGIEPELAYLFNREVTLWEGGRKLLETDLEKGWLYGIRITYAF